LGVQERLDPAELQHVFVGQFYFPLFTVNAGQRQAGLAGELRVVRARLAVTARTGRF